MDIDKIIKENDFVICNNEEYKGKNVVIIKDSTEFLKWFMGDKSLFSKKSEKKI